MKRLIFSFVLLLSTTVTVFSQVTANPALPTDTDQVVITFDATQGSAGLKDFTGDVYAHTGVITNLSTNGSDWKYVIAGWTTNTTKAKLTALGNNKFQLTIGPSIRAFYGVPAGETIKQLAFVFRNSDGSKTGKTATGGDIFVDVYKIGLAVSITSPTTQPYFTNAGASFNIQVEASQANEVKVFVDNNLLHTANSNSFSYSITAATSGSHWIKVEATDGVKTEKDSIYYVVRSTSPVAVLPANVRDGINYIDDNTVTLVLHAPYKNSVYVIGDFNNWEANSNYIMNRTTDSNTDKELRYWITLTGLTSGKEYIYQYLIDEELKIADPYTEKISDPWNDKYILAETYPALINYPEGKTTGIASVFQTAQSPYNWQVTNYIPPRNEDLVIYELLVRDFASKANYQTLIDTIGYFKKLGINAIELMPTNEFEGNDSWGYNPSFYFAPDKAYGTKNKMKEFIDVCHQNGISVFIDLVLNHSYGQSPFVQMYFDKGVNKPSSQNLWYNVTSNFQNPDAQWGYDFNHNSIYTRNLVDSINGFWIKEYKVDGFRFDFTKGFSNTPYGPSDWGSAYDVSRISNLKRMADEIWKRKPNAYISFEHLSDNTEEKELANYGINLWGNMNYNYNEATMGYAGTSDFSGISYKNRGWSSPHLVGYMESHDEERLMYKNITYGNSTNASYNIKNIPVGLARNELAALFFFTVPGPKMIWQFGELGYDISINQNGRVGRKPIHWEYFQDPNRKHLWGVYSQLINLKKNYSVFSTNDFSISFSGAKKWIKLNGSDMKAVAMGNFDIQSGSFTIDFQNTGRWYEYFTQDSIDLTTTSFTANFNPGEYRLYTTKRIKKEDIFLGINDNTSSSISNELELWPNPSNGSLSVSLNLIKPQKVNVSVYSIIGQKVFNSDFNNLPSGKNEIDIQMPSDITPGIYICRITSGKTLISKKLMIQ